MKDCIIIAGMHRSGTSALAGAMQKLGVCFGSNPLPGVTGNAKGFFEHKDVYRAHEQLLAELTRTWCDPRPLPADWLSRSAAHACEKELIAVICRDFTKSRLWSVKDPRLCRLLPIWLRAFTRLDITPRFVLSLRHPCEVADSLRCRDDLHADISGLLWLAHVLEAEKTTRGYPRHFVQFESLLHQPIESLDEISAAFETPWPRPQAMRDAGLFVDPSLRHADKCACKFDEFGRATSPIKELWQMLSRNDLNSRDAADRFDEFYSAYLDTLQQFDPVQLNAIGDLLAKVHALESALHSQNEQIQQLKNSWPARMWHVVRGN